VRGCQVSLRLAGRLDAVSASGIRSRVGAASERSGERGGALGRWAGVKVPARGRQLGVLHRAFDGHELDGAGDEQ
jgi:hypothetical protein